MTEFRRNMIAWCADCVSGLEPDDRCKKCVVTHIKMDDDTQIGRPSNFEEVEDE